MIKNVAGSHNQLPCPTLDFFGISGVLSCEIWAAGVSRNGEKPDNPDTFWLRHPITYIKLEHFSADRVPMVLSLYILPICLYMTDELDSVKFKLLCKTFLRENAFYKCLQNHCCFVQIPICYYKYTVRYFYCTVNFLPNPPHNGFPIGHQRGRVMVWASLWLMFCDLTQTAMYVRLILAQRRGRHYRRWTNVGPTYFAVWAVPGFFFHGISCYIGSRYMMYWLCS